MSGMKFLADLRNKKLIYRRLIAFHRWLVTAKPGLYMVEIKKPSEKRSTQHNRYYWGVIVKAYCEYVGYDFDNPLEKEDAHEVLKQMFLRSTELLVMSSVGDIVKETMGSTHDKTVIEFAQYVERIKVWLAKEGVLIDEINY